MNTTITAQIEARALALHQTRKDNTSRHHGKFVAELMTFDGGERDFCIASATQHIAEEAYQSERQTAEDRFYADMLGAMNDQVLADNIARLDHEIAELPHLPLTVNIADRGARLRAELVRFTAERDRRDATHQIAAE